MSVYAVLNKETGAKVHEYISDSPVEWSGMSFDTHNHVLQPEVAISPVAEDPAAEWRINVGPFFDRFGQQKIAILASTDPVVQAIIKDATVRHYIDLKKRRAELAYAISVLQAKGFSVSAAAILDVKPNAEEVFNG